MESKRQSKLPDGLGKKIIQALKTQGTTGETPQPGGIQPPASLDAPSQGMATPAEDHGIETISHMDFGSQEVHYGQEEELFQPAFSTFEDDLSSPGFDNAALSNQAHQYGSFVDGSQEDFSMTGQADPHFQAGEENTAYMSQDQADQGGFEDFGYNQQSYEEFDYNQQSYDNFETPDYSASGTEENLPDFQMPQLGSPSPGVPGAQGAQQPQYQEFSEDYGEFEDGYGYETEGAPPQHLAPLDDFGYTTEMTPAGFEGQSYQPELEQYDDYSNEEVQIGYSQESIISKPESKAPLDLNLDSVPTKQAPPAQEDREDFDMPSDEEFYSGLYAGGTSEAKQDKHYQQPKKALSEPEEDEEEIIISKKRPSRAEEHEPRIYRYEEDDEDDRYYEETRRRSSKDRGERYRQEDDRDYDDRRYNERRYGDRRHEESDREYKHYDDRYYDEEDRREASYKRERYHRDRDIEYRRHHHEDERDYRNHDDDYYYEKPRRGGSKEPPVEPISKGAKDSKGTPHRAEVLSSNVETLVRLVTSLPPGVTKQTGAQIIRQTMEAMGISMTEVLADAQDSHKRLHRLIGDSFNKIEEHKTLVRNLEDDIHSFQRRAKELDDIINLFVFSEKHRGRH